MVRNTPKILQYIRFPPLSSSVLPHSLLAALFLQPHHSSSGSHIHTCFFCKLLPNFSASDSYFINKATFYFEVQARQFLHRESTCFTQLKSFKDKKLQRYETIPSCISLYFPLTCIYRRFVILDAQFFRTNA